MKLIACLAMSLLALATEPALAAPAPDAAQAETAAPARPGRVDDAMMRAAVEARKEQAKRANRRNGRAADDDCPDCPEAARRHVHPTASEAPTIDCTHCIDRPAYA